MILDSFVAGTGEGADPGTLAGLRAGMALRLRPGRGRRVEVVADCGARLGWLPWEDARAIPDPEAATVRVTALVPSLYRPRTQIRVAVAA